jgi:hypothetical protein
MAVLQKSLISNITEIWREICDVDQHENVYLWADVVFVTDQRGWKYYLPDALTESLNCQILKKSVQWFTRWY